MDKALSALDPRIRSDMQGILLKLQEELHKIIVFITHDLDEALRIRDDCVGDFIKDINRAHNLTIGILPLNIIS
tara:strand:+ start:124 stop:345 length:222 start_codon:yes stop_codon:yes gene_type:complete